MFEKVRAFTALLGMALLASAWCAPLRGDGGEWLDSIVIDDLAAPALGTEHASQANIRALLHESLDLADDVSAASRHLMGQPIGKALRLFETDYCMSFGQWFTPSNHAQGGKAVVDLCGVATPAWRQFYYIGNKFHGLQYNQCLSTESNFGSGLEHRPCDTSQQLMLGDRTAFLKELLPEIGGNVWEVFRIKYAHDPTYCVSATLGGQVLLKLCSLVSTSGYKDVWAMPKSYDR